MEDKGVPNDSPVVTLQEALEEYEELEKVSTAVLGASDPSNCSYSKGYMKRQALYACLTCNPKASPDFQPAGICLGCSYKCHDGHDLVELYTKRSFRCDCGNKKFPDNPCILEKEKEDFNYLNSYNQNFSGLYCTCHRPYPDPEESEDNADPMIQCAICEDWLHTRHAIRDVSWDDFENDEQGIELICGDCMPKLDFLCYYGSLQAKIVERKEADVNVETDEGCVVPPVASHSDSTENTVKISENKVVAEHRGTEDSSSQDSGIASLPEAYVPMTSNTQLEDSAKVVHVQNKCQRADLPKIEFESGKGSIWSDGWRKKLCVCSDCKDMYNRLKVGFLIDEEDTMETYEKAGKARTDSEQTRAEESFNKQVDALGRVGQIELVAGYNDMKEALKEYLAQFAANGKVVGERDVTEFFENLRATKRPRLDENFRY